MKRNFLLFVVIGALCSGAAVGCGGNSDNSGGGGNSSQSNTSGGGGSSVDGETYTITWKNWDDSVLSISSSVKKGTVPTYDGTPTRESDVTYQYTFSGWSPEVVAAVADATYVAQYSREQREYTISFNDYNGLNISTIKVLANETPTPPSNPTRESDAEFSYEFDKWVPSIVPAVRDTIYTATYKNTKNKYLISWLNWDNSLLGSEEFEYGATPTYDGTPTRSSDGDYAYNFSGWEPFVTTVTGATSYKAVYDSVALDFQCEYNAVTTSYILKKYNGIAENITIPETFNDGTHGVLPISMIKTSAFEQCSSLRFVTIGSNITSIGSSAFSLCSNLERVLISKSVISIGASAFAGCSSLTIYSEYTSSSDTPSSWVSGWKDAATVVVYAVSFIDDIGLLGYVRTLADESQNILITGYIGSSETLNIPNSYQIKGEELIVTMVSSSSFLNNLKLKTVTMGNNITRIGDYAFSGCNKLENIQLSSALTSLGSYTFSGCVYLTSLSLPSTLKTIDEYTFYNCYNLSSINLPNSLLSINNYAFKNCSDLKTIIIHKAVTYLGTDVFNACTSLTIYYEGSSAPATWETKWNQSSIKVVYNVSYINQDGLLCLVDSDASGNPYVKISGYNKQGNTNVVSIPETVTIEGVELPVTEIITGSYQLQYCIIYIPSSIKTIASYALNISNATIYCKADSELSGWGSNWNGSNDVYYGYDTPFIDNSEIIYATSGDALNKTATIIGYNSLAINRLDIANTVHIDEKDVTINSIGAYAFRQYNNLNYLTLTDNIIRIGLSAFASCTSLKQVIIPNTVSIIDQSAFASCTSLMVYCEVSSLPSDWSSSFNSSVRYTIWGFISFGETEDGLQYAVNYVDYTNITIIGYTGTNKDVVVPDSITYGESGNVTIHNLAPYAFSNNDNIETIHLDLHINTIVATTFINCKNLRAIYFALEFMTSIAHNSFVNCPRLTLYFAGSVDSKMYVDSNPYVENYISTGKTIDGFEYAVYKDSSNVKKIRIQKYVGSSVTVKIPKTITVSGEDLEVTGIDKYAFENCTDLTSIVILDNVTYIGDNAFAGCSSLNIYCEASSKPSTWSSSWNSSSCSVTWSSYGVGVTNNGIQYTIYKDTSNNKYISITGYVGTETQLSIPDTINVDGEDIKVTTIEENAFANCTQLTSISIHKNVTLIKNNAFLGCTNLTIYYEGTSTPSTWQTNWNPSNRPIVYSCYGVGTIDGCLDYYIQIDGDDMYVVITNYNGKKGDVVIPDSIEFNGLTIKVTTLAEEVFKGNMNLTSIVIGDNITSIEANAFQYCANLLSVTIGDGITKINSQTFYGCTSLTTVILGANVTSIGSGAFYNCANLSNITFDDNLQIIGDTAFVGCSALTELYLPSSLTLIGYHAFSGCSSLKTVFIPISVTTISNNVFNCNTTMFYCEASARPTGWDSGWNSSSDNVIWSCYGAGVTSNGLSYIVLCDSEGNKYIEINGYTGSQTVIVVPSTITFRSENIVVKSLNKAFNGNENITSVTLPNTITNIGEYTFSSCTSLTTVIIPNSVITINDFAFSSCTSLVSITLPNTLVSIGDYAFYNCTSLASITIPSSVTSIGERAFHLCNSITSFTVDAENLNYASVNGVLFSKDLTKLIAYPVGNTNTVYVVPAGVTSIENYAFANCTNLVSVTLPDTLVSIGDYAFYNCTSLTSVNIPDSVTTISYYAFKYCTSLVSVYLPATITTICWYAFGNCSSLTIYCAPSERPSGWDSTFNDGVKQTIYSCLGYGVTVDGLNYAIISETDGGKHVVIVNYTGIATTIYIPDTVIFNGENVKVTSFGSVFSYNKNITSVRIGNNVTSIDANAFSSCTSLSKVSIGTGVTSIGSGAFNGCSKLYYLYIPNNVITVARLTQSTSSIVFCCQVSEKPAGWSSNWNYNNQVVWSSLEAGMTAGGVIYSISLDGDAQKFATIIGCDSSLTYVDVPNYIIIDGENIVVTTINSYAFRSSKLTTITIPNTVTTILANGIFGYSLTIYCEAASKPSGWDDAWNPNSCPVVWGYSGQSGITENGLKYVVCVDANGDKYIVIVKYIGTERFVVVPSTISVDGEIIDVTSIGMSAFYNVIVYLPKSVISLDSDAFSGNYFIYSELTNKPSDWARSSHYVFSCVGYGTTESGFIYVDNGKIIIADYAGTATNVSIPNIISVDDVDRSVTNIGDYAFVDSLEYESIFIPSSVEIVNEYSFSFTSLTILIYVELVSPIDYQINSDYNIIYGFASKGTTTSGFNYALCKTSETGSQKYMVITGYTGTEMDVIIPDIITLDGISYDVLKVNNYAFNVLSITSVVIGNNVVVIGRGAFNYCTLLESVTLGNSVQVISNFAFSGCKLITSMYFPKSVILISDGAFSATSLTYAYFEGTYDNEGDINIGDSTVLSAKIITGYIGISGVTSDGFEYSLCQDKDGNKFITITGYSGTDVNLIIPDTILVEGVQIKVTKICGNALSGHTTIESIIINDNVTYIGHYAFMNCTSLSNITIGSNVIYIGEMAFGGCTSLTAVFIPASVTLMQSYIFYSCNSSLVINCEASSQPSTWSSYWNADGLTVNWGSSN